MAKEMGTAQKTFFGRLLSGLVVAGMVAMAAVLYQTVKGNNRVATILNTIDVVQLNKDVQDIRVWQAVTARDRWTIHQHIEYQTEHLKEHQVMWQKMAGNELAMARIPEEIPPKEQLAHNKMIKERQELIEARVTILEGVAANMATDVALTRQLVEQLVKPIP